MDAAAPGFDASLTQAAFWIAALRIMAINILLSGDNAVVIALACRDLPSRQRLWRCRRSAHRFYWRGGAADGAALPRGRRRPRPALHRRQAAPARGAGRDRHTGRSPLLAGGAHRRRRRHHHESGQYYRGRDRGAGQCDVAGAAVVTDKAIASAVVAAFGAASAQKVQWAVCAAGAVLVLIAGWLWRARSAKSHSAAGG